MSPPDGETCCSTPDGSLTGPPLGPRATRIATHTRPRRRRPAACLGSLTWSRPTATGVERALPHAKSRPDPTQQSQSPDRPYPTETDDCPQAHRAQPTTMPAPRGQPGTLGALAHVSMLHALTAHPQGSPRTEAICGAWWPVQPSERGAVQTVAVCRPAGSARVQVSAE